MRSKRVFKWLAIAILAVAVLVLVFTMSGDRGRVTLQVQGQTNINGRAFCTIVVSNDTGQTLSFDAWSEFRQNAAKWKRQTLEHQAFVLTRGQMQVASIAMPTNGKPRDAPVEHSDYSYWRDRFVLLLGKNPSMARKLYVELE